MALDGTESCCSSARESGPAKNHPDKLESYREVLHRLRSREEACRPGFEEELSNHFNRLPARYAMDVNVERAEDVLTHMKLLQQATDIQKRPVFVVRVVQVPALNVEGSATFPNDDMQGEEPTSNSFNQKSVLPLPMFGSSANLEALANEAPKKDFEDSVSNANMIFSRPMYEVTFASDDRPKLLSKLTSLLGEVNLNIEEAHAFSTNDGYSLDVFVVKGQNNEGIEQLTHLIENEVQKIRDLPRPTHHPLPALLEQKENGKKLEPGKKHGPDYVKIPTDEADVWEIDIELLKFGKKVASGSYGDLYRGTYHSQDVAIKMLKPERVSPDLQKEFQQEVYIMRKVRHKNVVQFIGACTRTPYLCIVTEFMSRGSVYDYLHKHNGSFKLPALIRVAIDISKGMNYLHQKNIIHRDLKAANLLMDENEVVKVADFGVARVKSESGVMTAETGTYRWMAPEVIEHKRYDHKCDVFSFGIVLWELLTRQIPYECYTPLQAAVGVVQKNLRPTIPNTTHPKLAKLLEKCWQQDPTLRPDFSEILEILQGLAKEVKDDPNTRRKEKSSGGFLSSLRLSH